MSDTTLSASRRAEFGKGPSRRLRSAGQIPAVLYGHGMDPVHLALPGHDTQLALKQANVLLTLEIEGEDDQLALPKAIQRDPLRGTVEHVDLVVVRRGEKVVVDVPVVTTGEVASGAVLTVEQPTLSVRAEATHLPSEITVDVEGLEAGSTVAAGEVVLPSGTELVTDPEAAVVVVAAPQAEVEAAGEGAEGAAGEGAEAEAGGPSAGAEGESA
jgi:large subunit ribosomal protein L25